MDLLKYHKIWDKQIARVFPRITKVPQPLKEVLSCTSWDLIENVIQGKRGIKVYFNQLLPPRKQLEIGRNRPVISSLCRKKLLVEISNGLLQASPKNWNPEKHSLGLFCSGRNFLGKRHKNFLRLAIRFMTLNQYWKKLRMLDQRFPPLKSERIGQNALHTK